MEPVNPDFTRISENYEKEYQWQLQYLKEKSPNDLFIFNKYILGAERGDDNFAKLGDFHKDLCHFITNRADMKKLVLIPRSHLKSKLITIGYTTQQICKNPKIRVLIYSATWQMAVDLQMTIQKLLKSNEKLIEVFGDLTVEATEWSQDRTRLKHNDKREATITAAGIDNNLVGGHFDLIIMDDVVNRDNIGTMEQIEKVLNRYKDSLDLLEPTGQLIVIGTRWHDSDLYGWILDKDNDIIDSYDVMIKRAYEGNIQTGDGFVPLWPGKFSQEELSRRLREEGWTHFSAQYLNDPVPEEDANFKRSWFTYYESPDLKGKVLNKFLTIDPAMSLEKEADFTGMIVTGLDQYGYIHILDIVRAKMSPNDLINQIFIMRDKWTLTDIGIELVAFQKTLAYALRDDPRFKSRPFHITELKPNDRTKDQRIKALQPLYENGRIIHNKLLSNNIYLEDELVRFPRSTHDDLIDALAYQLDFIFPARQKAQARSVTRYLY